MSEFVVVEGMNGSGKSTLAKLLAKELRGRGKKVLELAFPTAEAPIGKLIREVLAGTTRISLSAMLPLFAAEACDWAASICETLQEGTWIVSDRYTTISARAYQLDTYTFEEINDLYRALGGILPTPSIAFIVDVPPLVALHRRMQRGTPQSALYEHTKLEELQKERDRYLQLLPHLPRLGMVAERLDGQQDPTTLCERMLYTMEGRL